MSVNGDELIGLFFEVTPHPGHSAHYFSYVEKLKPELAKHPGLAWLNRYQTLSDDCSLLSYQLWKNEKSIEGEIYISMPTAKENAKLYKQSYDKELARLVIHGSLHLLGIEDDTAKKKEKMIKLEEYFLKDISWEELIEKK